MKIMLVLPAGDAVRVTCEKPRVPKRNMLRFSILPLTTVAALTPPEHEVAICDENVQPLDLEADVDVVGISFMTALAPRAYEIADAFRARGKRVIAGGYHPTFLPEEAAEHFDAVVVGEAEGTWPRVLADIEAGRLQRVYRPHGQCDLSEIPMPRRDLTAGTAHHYVTTNAVQTGRGCRHSCRYCSITAFHGRTHRSRPLPSVLEELRGVPRDFMFVDDNIIADREYARTLFRSMIPLRKRWVAQCSLELADDPDLLRLAGRAGCIGLFIGIETLSEENLAAVEKGFNDTQGYLRRISRIRRHGIGIVAGIIVGMDGDDPGAFERTLRFLQKARIDAVQVNVMTPLPGTPLFDELRGRGRILDFDWSRYDFRHCVIRPARMSASQLQEGADWLYAQFYRLDRILLRFARAVFALGWIQALVGLRLNLTYRYDNLREGIVGRNPAAQARAAVPPKKDDSRFSHDNAADSCFIGTVLSDADLHR
jgi:radical SAM superfamily enzyme YgiQ (UPF0313 family)